MEDVTKMDSAALTWELVLLTYAIFTTILIVASLYYFLWLFSQFQEGRITAIECSAKLNFVVPFKAFLHIHCSIILLIYGHPELFALNIRMMIWHFRNLPVGYPANDIEQPERVEEYKSQIWRHIFFYIAALGIYAYCLHVIGNLKVAELSKGKDYNYQGGIHIEGDELLFALRR